MAKTCNFFMVKNTRSLRKLPETGNMQYFQLLAWILLLFFFIGQEIKWLKFEFFYDQITRSLRTSPKTGNAQYFQLLAWIFLIFF